MTFGQKLRAYREEKKLTLEELSEILGTTKQVLSRYEREERTPKITTARDYAERMGVDLVELIDDTMSLTIDNRIRDIEKEQPTLTEEEQRFLDLLRKLAPKSRVVAYRMVLSFYELQEQEVEALA